MKELVKKILKSSWIGKSIYPIVRKCYRLYAVPARRARLQRCGVSVLKNVDDVCRQSGIEYFVDFGTLLGIVRDNGFIKNDDDIDISIIGDSADPLVVLKKFLSEGFCFVHALTYRGVIKEFTVSLNKLTVDFFFSKRIGDAGRTHHIFYFDPNVNYKKPEENSVKERVLPYVKDIKRVCFKEIEIMVPDDCENYLAFLYGKSWKIPDPTFVTGTQSTYEMLPDYGVRVTNVNDL